MSAIATVIRVTKNKEATRMTNIEILTEYINSQQRPKEFMKKLFGFIEPRVDNVANRK